MDTLTHMFLITHCPGLVHRKWTPNTYVLDYTLSWLGGYELDTLAHMVLITHFPGLVHIKWTP